MSRGLPPRRCASSSAALRARRPVTLAVIAAVLAAALVPAAAAAGERVELTIGSVLATDSGREFDSRLVAMKPQFDSLFRYSSYRLMKQETRTVGWGEGASFEIPGGRYPRRRAAGAPRLQGGDEGHAPRRWPAARRYVGGAAESRCAIARRTEAAGGSADRLDRRERGMNGMIQYVYDQTRQLFDAIRQEATEQGLLPLLEPVAPFNRSRLLLPLVIAGSLLSLVFLSGLAFGAFATLLERAPRAVPGPERGVRRLARGSPLRPLARRRRRLQTRRLGKAGALVTAGTPAIPASRAPRCAAPAWCRSPSRRRSWARPTNRRRRRRPLRGSGRSPRCPRGSAGDRP